MDRYELVFDIIEHPEKYSKEQIEEILSDPETREIYNIVCRTDSAVEAHKEVDVDAEWERFSQKYVLRRRRIFPGFGSRAASISVIIFTSIVAVAAGIAVTVSVSHRNSAPIAEGDMEKTAGFVAAATDTLSVQTDTVKAEVAPVMFENEPLEVIMKKVATAYDVEVKFENKDAASLHLYYKLDTALPLDEVVSQLNTFEQINIRRKGNILTID